GPQSLGGPRLGPHLYVVPLTRSFFPSALTRNGPRVYPPTYTPINFGWRIAPWTSLPHCAPTATACLGENAAEGTSRSTATRSGASLPPPAASPSPPPRTPPPTASTSPSS